MLDASGLQTYSYGKMSKNIENIHTFVVPKGELYTFKMTWEYDSWNRINNIIYSEEHTIAQCSDGIKIELKPDLYYIKKILDEDKLEKEQ